MKKADDRVISRINCKWESFTYRSNCTNNRTHFLWSSYWSKENNSKAHISMTADQAFHNTTFPPNEWLGTPIITDYNSTLLRRIVRRKNFGLDPGIAPRDWTQGWTLDWTSSHQDGMRSYIRDDIFLPLVTCKYISDLFEKEFWSLAWLTYQHWQTQWPTIT